MIFILEAENRMIVTFVWTKHRNVTDRQTDGQNLLGYYSDLHCQQCGRAIKTVLRATLLPAKQCKSHNSDNTGTENVSQ